MGKRISAYYRVKSTDKAHPSFTDDVDPAICKYINDEGEWICGFLVQGGGRTGHQTFTVNQAKSAFILTNAVLRSDPYFKTLEKKFRAVSDQSGASERYKKLYNIE